MELATSSNLLPDGSIRPFDNEDEDMIAEFKGNMAWHQDSTYMPIQARGAVFSAITVPEPAHR